MTKRLSRGFGLTETLLTLGALSALSLGIYMVLAPASASATTKKEQDNLRDLSSAVERSWGLLGSYSGVSTARVEADGLAPTRMRADGRLRTSWGTAVDVVPHSVREPNDAFLVAYPLAPAAVCARLASAVARNVYDVRVDGVSVFDDGKLNPSAAAAACGKRDSASMEFVYYSGLVAGTAVAAPPLSLPPVASAPATPSTPVTVTPVGPVAPAGPADGVAPVTSPPAVPTPAAPSAPATPGAPSAVVPAPPVSPPSLVGAPGNLAACQPRTDTQDRNVNTCPAGGWGFNTERRTQPWTCPEAWDAPVAGVWSAWSQTSSHCNACPGPAVERQTQWVGSGGANCPAGQYGGTSWEREQVQERVRSYNCPAGTAALPAPSFTAWSGWSDTGATRNGSGSCHACPGPQTQRETQWVGGGSQPCPAGQEGTHSWDREQARERTGSYNCPAGTASLPTVTWSAPSAWADTGARRNESNTCATPAPPPAPSCAPPFNAPGGPVLVSGFICLGNVEAANRGQLPWNPPITGGVVHSANYSCRTGGPGSTDTLQLNNSNFSRGSVHALRAGYVFDYAGQRHTVRFEINGGNHVYTGTQSIYIRNPAQPPLSGVTMGVSANQSVSPGPMPLGMVGGGLFSLQYGGGNSQITNFIGGLTGGNCP